MVETTAPAADAPLSVETATGLLDAAVERPREDEEGEVQEQPSEAEPPAEDLTDPEEPAISEDEEAQPDDPETPVIAAPKSWDANERALFATLSPEAQQVIAARESERDQAVSRSQTEAAKARQQAEQEVQSVTQLRAATEQVLNRVGQIFHGKWDNVDWVAWAQQDPAAYTAGKAQFEAEQQEMARLGAAHQAQQTSELRAFQARKAEQIKTLAPELVDPAKGPARVQSLERFLQTEVGVDPSVFHTLDANVIALAYDGFRYRQAQKSASAKQPVQARAAVRPAAAQPARSPQRATEEVTSRFNKSGSLEDAVALLNSRSKANGRPN